jgi:hypothetical protein
VSVDAQLAAALDDMLEEVAAEYCDDLSDFLFENHRITGLLAESIGYERVGPGAVDAGSGVPYAGLFEAKTGAVEQFTEGWQPKGGTVAVNAAKKAVSQRLK